MRVTEIARIEVADVLTQSGAIRPEVSSAAITKGCRQRCIYFTRAKTLRHWNATWSTVHCGTSERHAKVAHIEASCPPIA
jgi:hypothetical protein